MDYGKEFEKYATKHHGINSTHFGKITSSLTPYIMEERQRARTHSTHTRAHLQEQEGQ